MGFSLKKAFKGVKKVVKSVAKVAAPVIGAYYGGAVGASIGGAIGGVASGGGIKGAIVGAGLSYAGANLLTSAGSASVFGSAGAAVSKGLDIAGKVANVFQVVKAINSTTGEARYIGIGETVPNGFTVDTTQAPLTVSSPTYENNLGASQPLNAQAVQAAALNQSALAATNKTNQLVMVAALGGLAYLAMKGRK